MKKILVAVVLVVVILVLGVAGLAMTKPTHYRIVRSATVGAPPAAVFEQIDDLHAFPSWSPWQKLDPAMQVSYSGAARGVGAIYEWKGNKDAGEGRMSITESVPADHVTMKLEFLKPFASTAMTTLKLAPEGEGTKVEWAMEGDNDFMGKVMCVFMDMDAMVGKDFVEGLANLDRVTREAAGAAGAAGAASADSSGAAAADTTAATH
ncbi:MAG: SRPBCC family protein [Candidatus Eisenbacteria bacterium]